MALATQCPFCQTTFRVAQDQLKLRGGLVRCGNCREVFDGNVYLLPVDTTAASPSISPALARFTAPAAIPVIPAIPAVSIETTEDVTALTEAPESSSAPATPIQAARLPTLPAVDLSATFASIAAQTSDAPWGAGEEENGTSSPALASVPEHEARAVDTISQHIDSPTSHTLDETRPEHDFPLDETPTSSQSQALPQTHHSWRSIAAASLTSAAAEEESAIASTPPQAAERTPFIAPEETEKAEDTESGSEVAAHAVLDNDHADHDLASETSDTPGFVQRAERRERMRGIAQICLTIGSGVFAVALLLQATYLWRNQIAALLPSTRPWLAAACAPLHCSVGLPTNIEQFVLDSSELQLIPPHQNIYSLGLLLRNRGYSTQAWPYIELTLNDADEKAILRRVFTPREYLASPQQVNDGLAGTSEQSVRLTFELNQALASGYRLYLFFP